MKKLFPLALLALVLILGCAKEEQLSTTQQFENATDPLSQTELNETIKSSIERNGIFYWSGVDDHFLWSAGMQSDSLFAVGYQTEGTSDLQSRIHQVNIESTDWIDTRDEILNLILEGEQKFNPEAKVEDLLPFGYPEVLPTMTVKITSLETIKRL